MWRSLEVLFVLLVLWQHQAVVDPNQRDNPLPTDNVGSQKAGSLICGFPAKEYDGRYTFLEVRMETSLKAPQMWLEYEDN